MAGIVRGRQTARPGSEEIVVFLIGMRINRLWQVWKWVPVFAAMGRMLPELLGDRSLGLVGRPRTFLSGRVIMVQQYWSSFDALEAYARHPDRRHLPAWRAFNRRVRNNGSVGIFHETYRIPPGASETVYANMPSFGLASAVGAVPVATGSSSAAQRLGERSEDTPPVEPY